MITITLRLSESLLSIFRDTGSPRPDTAEISLASATTVKAVLLSQGINPLLVPMASFQTGKENRRVEKETPLTTDGILTLYGPLAGG